MSSFWGNNIKLSLFGESHGKAIGVVIDGLPAGIELNFEDINAELNRRRPGKSKFASARKELDSVEIISGYFNNKTTGTPLTALIYNTNQKPRDYDAIRDIMRPSHADYTGYIKYKGANDYRGGGHFSGRLTAPIVFAGAIAKQLLANKGVYVGSHIKSIYDIEDSCFNTLEVKTSLIEKLFKKDFCVIDDEQGLKMKDLILKAKESKDSVGGIIEAVIVNLPPGVGNPFFNSIESRLSQILFSIPAVKGVEFGTGFDITKMIGSKANDELYIDNNKVKTYSNNSGGIIGGISNGMPLIFRVAIKPTPSIGSKQRTINIKENVNTTLQTDGRHDPCIVPRAIPVIEAAASLATLDLIMGGQGFGY